MITFFIPEAKETDNHLVCLELVLDGGDVIVRARGTSQGHLIRFSSNGTIHRCTSIGKHIGFRLDTMGRVEEEE